MKKIRTIEDLPIDSTKLCCNFVNTVYAWKGDDQYDFLVNYDAFIDWCIKLSVYEKRFLNELRQLSQKIPLQAGRAMKKISRHRLLIRDLLSAIANNDYKKTRLMITEANPFIAHALAQIKLEYSEGVLVSSYKTQPMDLMSPVWVIQKSLYDLLTSGDHLRIKECSSCGWVFYDETKNGMRRWCNPLTCGTKDKMDRYTQKLKELNKQ
jgi:predicted RNA-binding Zn ribbon-like protein